MALQIAKETPAGVSVAYWRVNPVMTVDMVNRKAYSSVMVYVSQAARTAGKKEVDAHEIDGFQDARQIVLEGATFETAIATGELRDAMYTQLKTLDFFSGATDLL